MSNKLFKIVLLSVFISKVLGSTTSFNCQADDKQLAAWQKNRRDVFKDGQSNLLSRGSTSDSFSIVSQKMIACCEHGGCDLPKFQNLLHQLTGTFQKVPKNKSIKLAWDLFLLLTEKSNDTSVSAKRLMITKAKEMMDGSIPEVDEGRFYTKMVSIIDQASASAT